MRRTIYSAELMCSYADTKMIPHESELELPEFKYKTIQKKNHWGRKEHQQMPELTEGPYEGKNPHPFQNSTGELWDIFWENYNYIGKSHFRKNRWEYTNCYWDEVHPDDLWTVVK